MLNVGQGESVLVREPSGKLLLFEGGPDDSVLSELGAILPPWKRNLDIVVLSHNHLGHIRGLISVFNRYSVGEVWQSGATHTIPEYRKLEELITKQHIHRETIQFPSTIRSFGDAEILLIHPISKVISTQPKNQHDADVVIRISYHNQSLLLTGDLNEQHESQIVRSCISPCTLQSDFLQVPHHGSNTGLTPDFLQKVNPTIALIPVGTDNQFGHPRKEILDRLTNARIPIYRTDTQGRIHCAFTPKPTCTSQKHPP